MHRAGLATDKLKLLIVSDSFYIPGLPYVRMLHKLPSLVSGSH